MHIFQITAETTEIQINWLQNSYSEPIKEIEINIKDLLLDLIVRVYYQECKTLVIILILCSYLKNTTIKLQITEPNEIWQTIYEFII